MWRALILSITVATSACGWPGYDGGGMDEVYIYARTDRVAPQSIDEFYDVTEKRHVLAEKIDEAKARVSVIAMQWRPQYPGRVARLEVQWGRAARTFAGDMLDDTMQDLMVLDLMIKQLESRAQHDNAPAKDLSI